VRTIILASVRTYARRYVAVLVAIVIATGFIVAIGALSAAARSGAADVVAAQYRGADIAAYDLGDVKAFTRVSGVAGADDRVTAVATNWDAYTQITFPDGPTNTDIGSIATSPQLRWQKLSAGHLPSGTGEIAVSASRARSHHVHLRDRVTLDVQGATRSYQVTGLVDDADGPLRAATYLPESEISRLHTIGFPIDIVMSVRPGQTTAVRHDLIAADLGGQVKTAAAYERKRQLDATQGIDIFQKLIYVFAAISLFVGALVIANTFTILLAQRSRDLALMRCVGALRGQIARSVVAEGAVLGLVGSLFGVVFGYLISRVGGAAVGHWSPTTPMATPSLAIGSVLISVALGVAVTVAAAWAPARRAGAQSPLAALQPQDTFAVRTRSGGLRLLSAALLILIGTAGLVVGAGGSLAAGLLGGMISFVGVLLATPLLVPAAIRTVGPLARRSGLAARLAHANALRNPRRTAATSTALLVGVTLITAVVVGTASISHKVNTSLDLNHPADLVLTAQHNGQLPVDVARQVSRVSGVAKASEVSGAPGRVRKQRMSVLGVTAAQLHILRGDAALRTVRTTEIVLPTETADPAVADGSRVRLRLGDQVRTLTAHYATGVGDVALINQQTFDTMGATAAPLAVWIRAADGANAGDVTSDVTAIAQASDLSVGGGLPDRADILKILNVVLAVTIGLLAIAVLIALIGVGNTLSLSVLERVRENSLLRALGLGRSGLRATLAAESLLMAGVSAVLGIALGATYAWFGLRTISVGIFVNNPPLTMPWGQIALILAVAALAGLAACVLPARRAARIQPAAGLVAE
jgi:putative ABC transport system permease protein